VTDLVLNGTSGLSGPIIQKLKKRFRRFE